MTSSELNKLIDLLRHPSESSFRLLELRKKALLLLSILAVQDDSNGRAIAEMLGMPPTSGKVFLGYSQVLWNPCLLKKHYGNPRIKDLLQLINKLDNTNDDPPRFFFFDPEKSLVQRNLQIYYVSYENLLKIVGDSMLHKVPDTSQVICGFVVKPPSSKAVERSKERESKSRGHSTSLVRKRHSVTSDKGNRSLLSAGYRVDSTHRTNTILNASRTSASKPKQKISKLFGSEAKNKIQSLVERQLDSDPKMPIKRASSIRSRQASRDGKLSTGSRQSSQNKRRLQLLGPLNSGGESGKKSFLLSSPKASLLINSTPRTDKPAGPLFFRKENPAKKSKPKDKEIEGYYLGDIGQNLLTFGAKRERKAAKEEDKSGISSQKHVPDMFDINKDHLLKMFATQGLKDMGSHSFLSKFSLLSSKTSIGESRHSIDKKKDLLKPSYGPSTPKNVKAKADLFRGSFATKKN